MKFGTNELELTFCNIEYWDFVRKLRNDPRVNEGFIQSHFISNEEQIEYMTHNSENYRIALVNGMPAGYIGVLNNDIRVCTHPDYQGMGVGKFLVNRCMEIWPDSKAIIKIDNEASIKLFESCGFSKKYILLEKSNHKK